MFNFYSQHEPQWIDPISLPQPVQVSPDQYEQLRDSLIAGLTGDQSNESVWEYQVDRWLSVNTTVS